MIAGDSHSADIWKQLFVNTPNAPQSLSTVMAAPRRLMEPSKMTVVR
jgi:hypothetical protein